MEGIGQSDHDGVTDEKVSAVIDGDPGTAWY
jgi:hypothetical protein